MVYIIYIIYPHENPHENPLLKLLGMVACSTRRSSLPRFPVTQPDRKRDHPSETSEHHNIKEELSLSVFCLSLFLISLNVSYVEISLIS